MGYEFIEIMPEVTLIKDNGTNIYLVEGRDRALVIDSGYGMLNLREAIQERTDKPLLNVLTHGHIDHAFGAHYFDKVYINKEEVPVYEEHYMFKKYQAYEAASGLSAKEFVEWQTAKVEDFEYISPGKLFDLGDNELEVISLKGHTPGSIGILDRKHRILFSGDAVINHIWMQLPHSSSIEEYQKTLNSLDCYLGDFDDICNGHSQQPLPVSFIGNMKLTLGELLKGAVGTTYTTQIPGADGMIFRFNGCEVVYNQNKIRNE